MSYLSSRTAHMMQQLLPKAAAIKPTGTILDGTIDVSTAENTLLRGEVSEIMAEALESSFATDAILSLPTTLGGSISTRSALANFFNIYFGPSRTVSPEQVVLTAGAGNCIEVLIQSICDEGDSVLIPNPSWFGFFPCISGRPNVNIIPVNPISLDRFDEDIVTALESAYDNASEPAQIKALILCNPQNPLSRCYSPDVLLKCIKFCQERNLHFISNEVYALTKIGASTRCSPSFVSALSIIQDSAADFGGKLDRSRIHLVWSASKLFGLSGLRIGCLVSQENAELRTAVSLLTFANTSSLSAAALETLLQCPQLHSLLETNSERLHSSYSLLCAGLNRLNIPYISASHGIFVFAQIAPGAKSIREERTVFENLQALGALVSPGKLYGIPEDEFGWARITFAIGLDNIELVLARIERALAS